MQRSISQTTLPILLGVLLAAAGCRKQQQAEATQSPTTAEQRPASEQVAGARSEDEADETKPQEILSDANALLTSIQDPVQQAAMKQWLSQARGVLIFPNVRKAAFVVGGRGGRGVMLARQPDGKFGSPAFYSVGGGSVGLQIGYERSSVILFITNDKALQSAMGGGFQLGSGASVAVGTMTESGRAAAGTAGADIISVVLDNDGVFAGASVNGALIEPQRRLNSEHYGSSDATAITTSNQFMQSHPAQITETLNRMSMPTEQGEQGTTGGTTQQGTSTSAQNTTGTSRPQAAPATQATQKSPQQMQQGTQATPSRSQASPTAGSAAGTQQRRPANP